MDNDTIPGIPSTLPVLKPGDRTSNAGPWSKHIKRLPWSIAKEGDLVKSVFVKFMMSQEKKREPVVRPTMGLNPERWNEDIGSNIHNVEAVFVHMAGGSLHYVWWLMSQGSLSAVETATAVAYQHEALINVPMYPDLDQVELKLK
ncbi:hypothetical protein PEX1_019840 [Penicillium expansum]|uniref:Uncharacterized protein n=1 Tax=Penicillium expansum TaxID=27334 RepID=A0A0A2JSM2_PENEN|nr:hypothetical protein PEX2_084030 [Penicillium expansum]KGO43661.1 hypothetical protein PEXP_095630 [Penicillium expansum]KGO52687.1 hypothetical protein PEX2_084030 [Penicillium expansum]KGO57846.1 hypothetical protein PEX1_019840 [Penicillium expansum]